MDLKKSIVFSLILLFYAVGTRGSVVSDTMDIAVLEDDAVINSGGFDSTDAFYYIARSANPSDTSGWRFLNLSIPQGTTVDSARLKTYGFRDCDCVDCMCRTKIYGESADNSVVFTSDNTPGDRQVTVVFVADSADAADQANGRPNWTVLVTSVIQEIVNLGGFVAENEISLIFMDNGSNGVGKTVVTWIADTHDAGGVVMRLIVWWTEAEGNPRRRKLLSEEPEHEKNSRLARLTPIVWRD